MANRAFVDDTTSAPPPPDIYRPIQTSDGYVVGPIAQDRQFTAMCKVVGREDLLFDLRFATAPLRFAVMNDLVAELETRTRGFTGEELLKLLRETRDVAISPVNSMCDFFDDPQARYNGTIFTINDPETGLIRQVKSMANLLGSSPPKAAGTEAGEQSRELLELGFTQSSSWWGEKIATHK